MMIRILFVHQFGGRGGASTMLANIIRTLDKQKFECIVVTPAGDAVEQFSEAGATVKIPERPIQQFAHTSGCHTLAIHPLFLCAIYRMLRDRTFWKKYIAQLKPNIVHLNAVTLAPFASVVSSPSTKVLCLVQETLVDGTFGLRSNWLKKVLREHVDLPVFISNFDREAFGFERGDSVVIPNWVNLKEFNRALSKDAARARFKIASDAKVVLFLGGISQIKGTLVLLEAAARARVRNLLVLIAGYNRGVDASQLGFFHRLVFRRRVNRGFDYHTTVMTKIADEPLRSKVRLLGMVCDIPELYAAADLVVFPAVQPHQSRPLLEAGAMAKPVIISDFPNIREFVTNGETALCVKPGDSASLAEKMDFLLSDPEASNSLGEGNYRATVKFHEEGINAARFADAYERLRSE
jgi:glycosyltransferase involved in cell wall biosynthesis